MCLTPPPHKQETNSVPDQLKRAGESQLHTSLPNSLKSAIAGIFTPWKLVNSVKQGFFFFPEELILKHQHTTVLE
jgi:hypothetical protein